LISCHPERREGSVDFEIIVIFVSWTDSSDQSPQNDSIGTM